MTIAPLRVTRETRWVEVDEAAALAGVPLATVRRWYRKGRIESRLDGVDGTRQLVDGRLRRDASPDAPSQFRPQHYLKARDGSLWIAGIPGIVHLHDFLRAGVA